MTWCGFCAKFVFEMNTDTRFASMSTSTFCSLCYAFFATGVLAGLSTDGEWGETMHLACLGYICVVLFYGMMHHMPSLLKYGPNVALATLWAVSITAVSGGVLGTWMAPTSSLSAGMYALMFMLPVLFHEETRRVMARLIPEAWIVLLVLVSILTETPDSYRPGNAALTLMVCVLIVRVQVVSYKESSS